MRQDLYGLPVTTATVDALEAYDRGVRGLLGWRADTLDHFRRAVDGDPSLALAHAGAALCLFLDERFGEAREAVQTARAAAARQTARERGHVEALALLIGGKPGEAEEAMREHLAAYPRDLAVLQRLYFVWFWQGRFPEMLEFTTAHARFYAGEAFVGGLHAFALEETGRCDAAVRLAEAAIRREPRDAWAVHAWAHAVYEMAAFGTGIARLPSMTEPCADLNWFRNHLVWHRALMYFGRGEYEEASAIGRRAFEPIPSPTAGDLHDSISLLWRLALVGMDVRARWGPFTAVAAARLDRQGLLFHAAHLAMALAGGGDRAGAARQQALLRERAPKDRTGLVAGLLLPLVEGLHAFAEGDYGRTIERIEPLRSRILQLGGSRAQRDVFHDTLLEACFRAGDLERAERLLVERLHRRPDHFWKTRTAT